MSGDRTPPKFEMIASTRRRWRREQKLAILAEVDAPGGSVSEVARRHGLHTSLLFRWRRDLSKSTVPTAVSAAPSFVPVMLPPPSMSVRAVSTSPKTGTIEIALAGGRTVRVGGDVDTAALIRIIDALEGHAGGVRETSR
jgi:transposase